MRRAPATGSAAATVGGFQLALYWFTQRGDVAPCAALWLLRLMRAEVYVNAERVLPCRESARNPKSQQDGKDDLVGQRLG